MISIRPDERLLRTLAWFAVTPQGQAILTWMEQLRIEQCMELADLTVIDDVRRAQGAVHLLQQLTEAIQSAPSLAAKKTDHSR